MNTPTPEQIERIRGVAKQMQADHGPEHPRHTMWEAMSRLLETVAMFPSSADPTDLQACLAVADAYLEATPPEPEEVCGQPVRGWDRIEGMCALPLGHGQHRVSNSA